MPILTVFNNHIGYIMSKMSEFQENITKDYQSANKSLLLRRGCLNIKNYDNYCLKNDLAAAFSKRPLYKQR